MGADSGVRFVPVVDAVDFVIKTGSLYSTLDMAKLGIETGLAIFQELQLLECNDEGIKLLPSAGKKLEASEIYRRGEQLKSGAADFQNINLIILGGCLLTQNLGLFL